MGERFFFLLRLPGMYTRRVYLPCLPSSREAHWRLRGRRGGFEYARRSEEPITYYYYRLCGLAAGKREK